MDILPELVARRARCSIAADPLPVEQIQRLLCAATLAPSCANTQPWRIVAVTGERLPAIRQALSEGSLSCRPLRASDNWILLAVSSPCYLVDSCTIKATFLFISIDQDDMTMLVEVYI